MNLADIRIEARTLLAETTIAMSYATEANLNLFINEGIKNACQNGAYERTKVIAVSNGVATYNLPIDFISPVVLKNPSGVGLDLMAPDDSGKRYIITGKPLYFYFTQAALTTVTRADLTLYAVDVILLPLVLNGYMYEVTTGGTTGGAPPAYPTSPGNKVTDGSAVLTCRELASQVNSLVLVDTPTTTGGGTGNYSLIYKAMDEGLYTDTDSPNFPADKHHLLSFFAAGMACVRAKQLNLSTVFFTSYAVGMGISVEKALPQEMQNAG